MTESKLDISNRLRREGRWGEASLFKDEKIRELRSNGMKRQEAQAEAWRLLAEEFPPVETPELEEEEPGVDFTPEQLAGLPPGSLKDFAAHVDWVYENLGTGNTFTAEPPSTGAAGLLEYARENKKDFYEKLLPKALQLLEKGPDSAEEAKQENLAHAKSLEDRIGHLLDNGRYTGEP